MKINALTIEEAWVAPNDEKRIRYSLRDGAMLLELTTPKTSFLGSVLAARIQDAEKIIGMGEHSREVRRNSPISVDVSRDRNFLFSNVDGAGNCPTHGEYRNVNGCPVCRPPLEYGERW